MTGDDLRASILQAAVQGKLVPQDKNDEPASVLLERVRAERAELVRQKKIRAPKGGESVITRYEDGTVWEQRGKNAAVEITDEIPFDIPDGWEWARMQAVFGKITDGTHHSPVNKETGDYMYVSAKNIKFDGVHIENITYVSSDVHNEIYARCNPEFGDILLIKDGATTGVVTRNNLYEPFSLLSSVALLKMLKTMNGDYLVYVLRSNLFREILRSQMQGTGITRVTLRQIMPMLVPVPPLAEQQRIVAKIDELMPLVERYDKLDRERTALNAAIAGDMRASILKAAVQGALTEREPTDEPAGMLLERVREERRELVKQKKAKAPKGGESVITRYADGTVWEQRGKGKAVDITDEMPFDIPDGWEWCRGTMLLDLLSGVDLKPSEYNDRHNGIPYLTGASNFGIDGLIENRWTEVPKRVSVAGDLLFTCKGTVGTMAYNTFEEAHIARQIMAIRPFGQMSLEYIRVVLLSMVAQIKASAKGVIPGIERDTILEQLVPVPPIAEQQRIVAKLDEMLPKVERLGEIAS